MVALNADDLVSLALSKRLDVRASTQAVQSSEERLLLQQRRVFPNVSVGVALERGERGRAAGRDLLADTARASVAAGALTAPEIEPRPNPSTDLIIGPSLSLELPIFDQNQAQIARAAYELEQAQCQLQWLQRSIEQDVRSAVDRAGTAWGIANFYRNEVMPQAEANLDLAQDAYHAGRSTILAILDAERTLLSTRDSYAVALLQAAATIPEIEQTVGVPFQELIRPAADTQPAAISEGE
jgi:cobalt-zinc-cadmium efflux system outer membrane protein